MSSRGPVDGEMLSLNLIHTVAFAGVVLVAGYRIRRIVPLLARLNIPAPVIGGLLVAVIHMLSRRYGTTLFQFDTSLQSPLMIAFFTTIGFSASYSLLKAGGLQVIVFFLLASFFAVVQNVVGILMAGLLGVHPLFGVIVGSVTLAGGPATGLAFAPLFEQAGVHGAATAAIAAAMAGIISAGLLGGPIGTFLIERIRLKQLPANPAAPALSVDDHSRGGRIIVPEKINQSANNHNIISQLAKCIVALLAAMWLGAWLSELFAALAITLPAYIGAMLVAAAMRNIDDATAVFGFSQRTMDEIGSVSLSLFIIMALMTLQLWELAGLALPLLIILLVQIVIIAAVCCWPIFQVMGRDYDAAVTSSGFCGFMLGTTANAMANMEALVERYGPAPRAFLIVPMVGAFFIDFSNALLITACVNIWK